MGMFFNVTNRSDPELAVRNHHHLVVTRSPRVSVGKGMGFTGSPCGSAGATGVTGWSQGTMKHGMGVARVKGEPKQQPAVRV